MTGIIVPRPVALVSTINSHGVANLAPFSFFSGVGSAPPRSSFARLRPSGSDQAGERKDTLRNVEETGEFVINVVPEALVAAANAAAARWRRGWTSFNWRDSPRFPAWPSSRPEWASRRRNGVPPHPGHLHRHAPASGVIVLVKSCASTCARIWWRISASTRAAWTPWAAWPATLGSNPDRIELVRPR